MTMKQIAVCDWKTKPKGASCGEPAKTQVSLTVGDYTYVGDLCDPHVDALHQDLARHGLALQSADRFRHARHAYVGSSGIPFTAAEVRSWLIEIGRKKPHEVSGRIALADITEYARTH